MGDSAAAFTLFSLTGALPVSKASGGASEYVASSISVRWSLALFYLACDCFYFKRRVIDEYQFSNSGGFSAQNMVVFSTNLLYQAAILNYFVLIFFKAEKIVEIFNTCLELKSNLKVSSRKYDVFFNVIMVSFTLTLSYMECRQIISVYRCLLSFCIIAIDTFCRSCGFLFIYFIALSSLILNKINTNIQTVSAQEEFNNLLKWQKSRDTVLDVLEDIQSLYGLPALITTLDHTFCVMMDCCQIMDIILDSHYSGNDVDINELLVTILWTVADVFFLIVFVVVCESAEREVYK
jgi:hypothetical protein